MPEDVPMGDTPMADATEVETFAFQAEIAQLMSLIINTFYSNKEIFLRELISNSSDALDKIRYESLMDPSKLDSGKDLYIKIIPNKNDRTLTIIDTGIGMTKSDLVNNLGTIAKSGTKAFMEALQAGADISMIGQFGVGFYSAYLVADRVTVSSKHNDDEQYLWESSAGGSFTICTDPGEPLGRGTKITLYIKEDQAEFLEEKKVKEIVKKHSQFIGYPIKLLVEKERDKELSDDEEEEEKEKDKVEGEEGEESKPKIEDAQALRDTSTMGYMAAKKHLEINPEHPVMETLRQKAEADKHDKAIGMTKSDLVNNLGTIAKSGTKAFMEALQAGADISMIGQFGVGFYSAYLVADRVTVSSKHNDDEQYLWESSAGGSFTICTDPGEPLGRGTKITLYIKEDQAEFLEEKKVKEIVKKHSQFIGYPIKLLVEKERDKELSDDEEEEEKEKDKVEGEEGEESKPKIEDAQALRDTSTMGYMAAKKHLEINPEHPVMETLRQKAEADKHDKAVKDLVMLLFETALLSSGFSLEDPQVHAARIYRMIKLGLGIDEEDTQPMEEDKVDEEMPPLEGGEEDASRMEEMPEDVKMQDAGEVETFAFQAEIAQLMSLIINTFYSNKEIFLRELISNSSDALDKIRYESLTDPSKLESGKDLYIKLIPNKNDRTLTIIDTGIGMTKSDLVNNLGTIAKSGTKAFMEALQAGADISMIGQFGVGFYSAYLVADRVTVSSKHNDDEQYLWESSAGGSFTICTDPGEPLGRGTKITLYIKEDQAEFLEEKKVKEIVKKHSQFIGYPIKLLVEKERDKELSDDEEEEEKEKDKVEGEEGEESKPKIEDVVVSNRLVESPCCIVTSQYGWTANMERIMKAQALRDTSTMGYMAAKKHLEINPEHPVMETLRQKAEADKHDKAIGMTKSDLVNNLGTIAKSGTKAFMEALQAGADISMIGQFGVGFYSAYLVADRVTVSSKHNDDEQYLWESSAGGSFTICTDPGEPLGRGTKITLYIKEDQAEFLEEKKVKEIVKKHSQFIGYPIKLLVEKERDKELSDDEEEEEKEKDKVEGEEGEESKPKIEDVVVSNRLVESPCCIVTSQYGWTANMERIMKAQALRDTSTMGYMAAKKHLEINPEHPVMETLRQKAEADKHDKAVKDLVMLLFETALLSSGFALEEPQVHAARIYRMIKLGLGIDEEDPHLVEEEKVDEEMPPLEGDGEDASRMEEVD
uniref:Heat shock protein 83 n=1 Tax=Timema shepardi TaxID=629360 RepID=A0A7R9G1R9_TIMSH|nr:unnamed protein product [Timema shepardi]